jgi:hypothetical protein
MLRRRLFRRLRDSSPEAAQPLVSHGFGPMLCRSCRSYRIRGTYGRRDEITRVPWLRC